MNDVGASFVPGQVLGFCGPIVIFTSYVAVLRGPVNSALHTREQVQRLSFGCGITCIISRTANVWDNAAKESFFLR